MKQIEQTITTLEICEMMNIKHWQILQKQHFCCYLRCVANSGGWDLWAYDGTVYSIPVKGSGGSASYWCALSQLRAHLFRLRTICRYNALIPDGWKNINREFLAAYGIA